MDKSLFRRTVKLAHDNPELRPALLPIIKKYADLWAEDELEAGRTWDGVPGKAYDTPPAKGNSDCYDAGNFEGKGKPGEGTCYNLHNPYGSGVSKNKKRYNEMYREQWSDGHHKNRKICPDGKGGKKKCGPQK